MVDAFGVLIEMIDEYLVALGTQTLVDGDRARDQLLDLRTVCVAAMVPEVLPENVG